MLSYEMSNDLLKLFEEENNQIDLDFEDISSIHPQNTHYLCKECLKFPKMIFLENQTVKLICDCKNCNKEIEIQDIFSYFSNTLIENNTNQNIICLEHNEKFAYYCTKCQRHLCLDCSENCDKKKHFLLDLIYDRKTRKRIKKILSPIKEKYLKYIKHNDEIGESEENSHFLSDSNETILIDFKNNCYKKNNNKNINSKENFSLIEEANEEYFIKLFIIIINDYKNFPNYNHIKNIANIELLLDYFYLNKNNEIKLTYKNNNDINNLKIFGDKFIKNNKDNFILIINKIIFELVSEINIKKFYKNINLSQIEIKLIQKQKIITDISYMFYDCLYLLSIDNFSNFNTCNIINMSYMFYDCSSLASLPDISKWKTNKVENISYMFYGCKLLNSLPEISKWNTINVKNMSYLFAYCSSLETLPDISKWDVSNVIDMSYMFYYCSILKVFPDISKWKINILNKTTNMFMNCSSLKNIPNYDLINNGDRKKKCLGYAFGLIFIILICCASEVILSLLYKFIIYLLKIFSYPLFNIYISSSLGNYELNIVDPNNYKDFTKINNEEKYFNNQIVLRLLNLISLIAYLITLVFLFKAKSLIYKITFFISDLITIIIDIYDLLKYEQLINSLKEFNKKHYVSSITISKFEEVYSLSFFNIALCAVYYILFYFLCRNRKKKSSNQIEQNNNKIENKINKTSLIDGSITDNNINITNEDYEKINKTKTEED